MTCVSIMYHLIKLVNNRAFHHERNLKYLITVKGLLYRLLRILVNTVEGQKISSWDQNELVISVEGYSRVSRSTRLGRECTMKWPVREGGRDVYPDSSYWKKTQGCRKTGTETGYLVWIKTVIVVYMPLGCTVCDTIRKIYVKE